MKAIVAIVQMFLLFKGMEALLGFPVAMGWLVADRITSLLAASTTAEDERKEGRQ